MPSQPPPYEIDRPLSKWIVSPEEACTSNPAFYESGTLHNLLQNSLKSPFVPSSTSCSNLVPYFFRYASFTFARCLGSQWNRTRRLTSRSVRSLEVSARAWCRRRASRTGRLSTPLMMWARVSPCVRVCQQPCLGPPLGNGGMWMGQRGEGVSRKILWGQGRGEGTKDVRQDSSTSGSFPVRSFCDTWPRILVIPLPGACRFARQ